jgi:hypothetical protein
MGGVMPDSPARQYRMALDTSIFTNPEVRSAFGADATGALEGFLSIARRLRTVEFFMPPSIAAELSNFIDVSRVGAEMELRIRRKAPKKYALTVPAFLLYELIEDVRTRIDKGLRVAEEAVRTPTEEPEDLIAGLRRKYREALREGIIDSKEDVDLILLALELDAVLVSADKGVVTWAEKLGIRWISPGQLKPLLEKLIEDEAHPPTLDR